MRGGLRTNSSMGEPCSHGQRGWPAAVTQGWQGTEAGSCGPISLGVLTTGRLAPCGHVDVVPQPEGTPSVCIPSVFRAGSA